MDDGKLRALQACERYANARRNEHEANFRMEDAVRKHGAAAAELKQAVADLLAATSEVRAARHGSPLFVKWGSDDVIVIHPDGRVELCQPINVRS